MSIQTGSVSASFGPYVLPVTPGTDFKIIEEALFQIVTRDLEAAKEVLGKQPQLTTFRLIGEHPTLSKPDTYPGSEADWAEHVKAAETIDKILFPKAPAPTPQPVATSDASPPSDGAPAPDRPAAVAAAVVTEPPKAATGAGTTRRRKQANPNRPPSKLPDPYAGLQPGESRREEFPDGYYKHEVMQNGTKRSRYYDEEVLRRIGNGGRIRGEQQRREKAEREAARQAEQPKLGTGEALKALKEEGQKALMPAVMPPEPLPTKQPVVLKSLAELRNVKVQTPAPQAPKKQNLLYLADAAEMAGMEPGELVKGFVQKRIPGGVQTGPRRWRVDEDVFLAWLDEQAAIKANAKHIKALARTAR